MPATTHLSVLGTTTIVRDGKDVALPRAKHRQVLAALALHPNRPVPSERLIDLVWGGRAPATALKTVQTYVSQLRRRLDLDDGPHDLAILTESSGYLLRVEPDALDATRLEQLVGLARVRISTDPARAHALLEQALELCRGLPYEDLGDHPSLFAERSRLDELRQTAEELHVDAEIALGHLEAIQPRIRELVERSPFRSRPLAQLMLVLHRLGRSADALEAYREADRRYRDELGIEPDPRLRDLQRRILSHDPDLLAAVPAAVGGGGDAEEDAAPRLREQRWVTVLAAAAPHGGDPLPVRDLARTIADYDGVLLSSGAREATAVFGVPRAHEDDAERAVRAGLALRMRHPEVLLAVEVGEASVEPTGDRGAPSISGEVFAATADRLGRVRSEGLRIGPRAARSLAHLLDGPPTGEGWTAVRRLDRHRRRPLSRTPIFGRDAELDLLASIWRRVVRTRRPHVVTLLGPAGVGKTRLCDEFLRAAATDAVVWQQRCLPYGDATYGAVAALVREVIGVADDAPLAEVSRKLDDWLARSLDPEGLEREAHDRLSLLGVLGDIVEHKDALVETIQRVVPTLARAPTVIVVDDLHWADDDLLDLLGAVARTSREAPLLLLLVSREELLARRPDWGGGFPASSLLDLDDLNDEDALEMASALAPEHAALAERIATAAGGNPLFMEELAAWVAQGGDLGELPATVRAIIGARLDQLSTAERRLLGIGAVIGPRFSRDALEQLAGDGVDLDATLAVLADQRLIAPEPPTRGRPSPRYSFRHDLFAEAAYATIPEDDRAALHRRAAAYLESRQPVAAAPSVLAHHWRRAGDLPRAVRYLLQAAREANEGWSRDRAVAFYDRALELLEEDDPRRRQASLERAVALQAWAHVVLDVGHRRPAEDGPVRAGSRRG